MKVVTLTQPYADLCAGGLRSTVAPIAPAKRIETRSWATEYRGPIAIHAGRGLAGQRESEYRAQCLREPFLSALTAIGYLRPGDLPRGAVIAVGELVACVRMTGTAIPAPLLQRLAADPTWNPEWERAFGFYAPGRYAWLLANVRRLPTPIPVRGMLGLWEWAPPADVEEWIHAD